MIICNFNIGDIHPLQCADLHIFRIVDPFYPGRNANGIEIPGGQLIPGFVVFQQHKEHIVIFFHRFCTPAVEKILL